MAKEITLEQYEKVLINCKKGKHKLRENDFGVVFCVRCGLLSTSVGGATKLLDEDKIIVKSKK